MTIVYLLRSRRARADTLSMGRAISIVAVALALTVGCAERQGLDFDVQRDDAGAVLPDAQAPRDDAGAVVTGDASPTPRSDAGAVQSDAAPVVQNDSGVRTDAQPQPQTDASPGADTMPQPKADTGAPPQPDAGGGPKADAGPEPLAYCAPVPSYRLRCGENDVWGDWHDAYKDGRPCSTCVTGNRIYQGCLVNDPYIGGTAEIERVCVFSCYECVLR
jgi:hypothetical protein